ncbi:MAG: M48 family metallopeptidase [Candidatus Abyssubacteria bacterium]
MKLLKHIARFIDKMAGHLADGPSRKLVKLSLYVLLAAAVLWVPYAIINHVLTSGFHVISIDREKQVGQQEAERLEAAFTLAPKDDPLSVYVNEIGTMIGEQNNPWNADFEFHVIRDQKTVNAFALPGGKIYITTGLLQKLDNEGEMAAVLAHEIAHVSRRHYARHLGRAMLMSWVRKFLGGTDKTLLEAGSYISANVTILRMNQEDEIEADCQGMLYIYDIGYDPAASITMVEKLLKMEQEIPASFRAFAASHPPSLERLDAVIRLSETLPEKDDADLGEQRYKDLVK